jgi:hypothetical protein
MKNKLLIKLVFSLPTIFLMLGESVCNCAELTNQMPSDEECYNQANPKMVWGSITNFVRGDPTGKPLQTELRSGINVSNGIIVISGKPLEVVRPVYLCIENCLGPSFFIPTYSQGVPTTRVDSTNVVWAFLPAFNERLVLTLTDTNGAVVPKTSAGMSLGKPPSVKPYTRWFRWGNDGYKLFTLFPKGVIEIPFPYIGDNVRELECDPTKYFDIKMPGFYKLTVIQRLYVVDTNTYLTTITLPPVTVDVRVENDVKE